MGSVFSSWLVIQGLLRVDPQEPFEIRLHNLDFPRCTSMGLSYTRSSDGHGFDGVLLAHTQTALGRIPE
jgi:hypothetical protein